jgi:hypothetical protein
VDETATDVAAYKRPWLAAVLTLAIPGLGHVYLRRWGRAVLWFLLIAATIFTLVPEWFQAASFGEMLTVAENVSVSTSLLLFGSFLLCVVDAYVIALQHNQSARQDRGETTTTCPNCGKELDGDLDFCHWCTTELDNQG